MQNYDIPIEVEAEVLQEDDEGRVFLRLLSGVLTTQRPWSGTALPVLICDRKVYRPRLTIEVHLMEDTVEGRNMGRFAVLAGYPVVGV